MADKAISELVAAEQITATDMFVLEQSGTAKKVTGQVLLNWLTKAADGHGGIQSIEKINAGLGVNSLVDTYRITLADTTTFDFMVTNGRGVTKIEKTATEGLVDIYTIEYNDGTTDEFPVANGAKGDKGDNAYLWIKYASQEPTASSHSFGDLPDEWIGVYFGGSSTAPTDWQQYKWFKIKGEKGETGDPATLVSSQVTYQVGDSGTVIPSGNWSTSVPAVAQGKFLWTRQILRFNTGDPVTTYSVARFGVDGTGAVSTVCGVAPDGSGNIPLTAEDVGAVSESGGSVSGDLTFNGTSNFNGNVNVNTPMNMNGYAVTGLPTPSQNNDATTKKFVEDSIKTAVDKATEDLEESITGVATGVENLDLKKVEMELVWQLADGTTSMAAGDLTLTSGNYAYYMLELKGTLPALFCRNGASWRGTSYLLYGGVMDSPATKNSSVNWYMRTFNFSNTKTTSKVVISDCYNTYNTSSSGWIKDGTRVQNGSIIPFRIWGIKGVVV